MSIISLKNVYKSYRMGQVTVHALNNLSVDIESGKLTVILGPSGSGKMTLLNLIGGIDSPSKGRIIVDGNGIGGMNARELTAYRRNNIGFIFQFFNLIPNLTARENVEFVLEYVLHNKVVDKGKAQKLLEKVGLGDRGSHFPYQLSGGEQQRIAIARALVSLLIIRHIHKIDIADVTRERTA